MPQHGVDPRGDEGVGGVFFGLHDVVEVQACVGHGGGADELAESEEREAEG